MGYFGYPVSSEMTLTHLYMMSMKEQALDCLKLLGFKQHCKSFVVRNVVVGQWCSRIPTLQLSDFSTKRKVNILKGTTYKSLHLL